MDVKNNLVVEPFRKYRSVGTCYSRGLSLVSDNFRCFFRLLSPVVALCALLSTLVNASQLFPYDMAGEHLEPFRNWFFILFLLMNLAVYCLLLSHIYTLIKMKASGHELHKLTAKFFYAESQKNIKYVFAWYGIMVPALCLTFVMAPIAYLFLMLVLPCLMLSGKTFWRGVQSGLRLGCRFFFRNLQMLFLLLFSVVLACVLINSPLITAYLMEYNAEASCVGGDNIVIPASYYYIAPVILFVTTFLAMFVATAFHTPIAYLYISAQTSYEEELTNTGKH